MYSKVIDVLATIIIPMYNAEMYIEKTLKSIIAQTYSSLQVIIINDGSTDTSFDICKSFQNKMPYMEIYSTENKGVSHARNEGLKYAKGDYIFFIDSDDVILPDYIEAMMRAGDEDYVRSGMKSIGPDGNESVRILDNAILTVEEHRKNFSNLFSQVPAFVIWGCRYRRSIIFDNKIQFREDIHNGEDVLFNIAYLTNAKTIRTTSYIGYIYCKNSNSSVGKFWPDRLKWIKEMNKAQIAYGSDSVGIGKIKLYGWEEALLHYKKHAKLGKDKNTRKKAKYLLKEAMHDTYFRDGISDIIKYGTIDMKLEALCLKFYLWNIYPFLLKFFMKLHNIKGK